MKVRVEKKTGGKGKIRAVSYNLFIETSNFCSFEKNHALATNISK